jgi:hypothetical protein
MHLLMSDVLHMHESLRFETLSLHMFCGQREAKIVILLQ